jgi:hypothetical protein
MAAPGSLLTSDSDVTTPQTCQGNIAGDIGIGIDKLALSLPISGIIQNGQVWDYVYPRRAEAHDYLSANASLHVTARQVGTGLRCTVEYNPSRLVDPYGWSLCRPEEVFPTVARVLGQLRGRVDFEGGIGDVLVTRLDVARDFNVSDPQFFLTGLRPLHRIMGANPSLWFDEVTGAASSLRVGTARSANPRRPNRVTLYDKGLMRPDATGVLRWELEARTWAGKYGGIKTLADLTPDRVESLALDRWAWSRMGEVVVSEDEFVDRAYSAEWLTDIKRDRFLGQYFGILRGKRVLGGSAREEFTKTQRKLGIAASEERGTARRLDLLTGTDLPATSEAS